MRLSIIVDGNPFSLLVERSIAFACVQSLVAVVRKVTTPACVATSPQPKRLHFVCLTPGLE